MINSLRNSPILFREGEHNPQSSRRLTQAEALELLQAENERGHVHSAWFKDAILDRFYSICNCCGCCCGGIEAMLKHGIPMVAPSGYVAQVDDPNRRKPKFGLDQLDIDRFRGIGFSSGAMTLIHIATRQPTRVEAMILIDGTIYER